MVKSNWGSVLKYVNSLNRHQLNIVKGMVEKGNTIEAKEIEKGKLSYILTDGKGVIIKRLNANTVEKIYSTEYGMALFDNYNGVVYPDGIMVGEKLMYMLDARIKNKGGL